MAEQQQSSVARQEQHEPAKSLAQRVFEENMAMAAMVLNASYLNLATNAVSVGLINMDLVRGVTTKNLTTTPSERMLTLLIEIYTKLATAKNSKEAKKIMKTFLDIVKADAAYRSLVKRIGKQKDLYNQHSMHYLYRG